MRSEEVANNSNDSVRKNERARVCVGLVRASRQPNATQQEKSNCLRLRPSPELGTVGLGFCEMAAGLCDKGKGAGEASRFEMSLIHETGQDKECNDSVRMKTSVKRGWDLRLRAGATVKSRGGEMGVLKEESSRVGYLMIDSWRLTSRHVCRM